MTRHCGESLGLLTTMLQRQEEEEEEQEDGGSGERQRGESCLRYYLFASSAKKCSPSCTSTMPAQNDRGYCTPNHCVVREGAREAEREKM